MWNILSAILLSATFCVHLVYLQLHLNNTTGSESKLKEGLPDECEVACLCALTTFQDVCGKVQSGDIPMSELRKIKGNSEQMKRLCAAATVQGDKKEGKQLSFNTVQGALQQRLEEFSTFEQKRFYLSHLCNHLSNIQGN